MSFPWRERASEKQEWPVLDVVRTLSSSCSSILRQLCSPSAIATSQTSLLEGNTYNYYIFPFLQVHTSGNPSTHQVRGGGRSPTKPSCFVLVYLSCWCWLTTSAQWPQLHWTERSLQALAELVFVEKLKKPPWGGCWPEVRNEQFLCLSLKIRMTPLGKKIIAERELVRKSKSKYTKDLSVKKLFHAIFQNVFLLLNYALYFSLYKMRNRSPSSTWSGWMSKILTEYFPTLRVRQEPRFQLLPPVFPRYLNKINVTQKNCNSLYKNQVPGRAVLILGVFWCDKPCSESKEGASCCRRRCEFCSLV